MTDKPISLKRILKLILSIIFICIYLSTPTYAADISANLVAKIQKSGLGCKDVKIDKTKILFSPKRTICTINNERTNIEVYSVANFKKATAYLCDAGFDVPILTDKKNWSIVSDSEETMSLIQKAVGGQILNTCKLIKK